MSNRQNQWDEPPSLTKTLGSIVTVIGTMSGFFAALSTIFSGLSAPIAALLIGFVISVVLFVIKFWTPQTAVITWLATSVALIIVYLIISQPATVTGQVIDDQEMPVVGLRLILTNSAGVEHRVVTDQNGNFEIPNVPNGRYTIIIETTGTLLYRNDVSSGWQRIFTPREQTGILPYNLLTGTVVPLPTPTNEPSPTYTSILPDMPTASPEPTNTIAPSPKPTETAIPSDTPTDTPRPSVTPLPTNTPTPIYEEDLEDNEAQGWNGLGSVWQIVRNDEENNTTLYKSIGTNRRLLYLPARQWNNFVAEFQAFIPDTLQVILCNNSPIVLNIDVDSDYVAFMNLNTGMVSGLAANAPIGSVEWIDIRIELTTSLILAHVDNYRASMPRSSCDIPEFGFGSGSLVIIDNIRVWALDD